MGGGDPFDPRQNHSHETVKVTVEPIRSKYALSSADDLPFPKASSTSQHHHQEEEEADQTVPKNKIQMNRGDARRPTTKSTAIDMTGIGDGMSRPTSTVVHVKTHYLQRTMRVEYDVRPALRASTGSVAAAAAPETPNTPSTATATSTTPKRARLLKSIGDYELIRTIGSGSTARVKMAINIRTNQKVAIKLIDRVKLNDQSRTSKEPLASKERRILREAAILYLLDHPNIVRLYDMIILPDYYCLIFELVEGAQMLDYIISHRRLKERMARKFFRQMLSAVTYCHGNGLVHRDLKIENVLIDREGNARIVDFGLSNFFHPRGHLETFCGSLYFAAPELLCGRPYVGPEVDVWSLGVILYVLVCGRVPFDDKSLPALHEKIKACRLELPPHLTEECRDLLGRMIIADPLKRITTTQLMTHPWTIRTDTRTSSLTSIDLKNVGGAGGGGPTISNPTPPSSLLSHPVSTYLKPRRPLDFIDGRIVDYLVEDFRIQYSYDEIIGVLRASTEDWSMQYEHPIIALYFLVKEKLDREGPSGRITSPYPTTTAAADQARPRPAFPRSLVEPPAAAVCRSDRSTLPMELVVARTRSISIAASSPMAKILEDEAAAPGGGGGFRAPANKVTSAEDTGRRRRFDSLPPEATTPLAIPTEHHRPRRGISLDGDREEMANQGGGGGGGHSPLFEPRIKTVYLRGLFSMSTTSTKPVARIVEELLRALQLCHVPWTERNGYLLCGTSELFRENDESTATATALEDPHDKPPPEQPINATATAEPTMTASAFGGGFDKGVIFEIHIVRLALLASIHGVQFKRVQGDFSRYKALCSRILDCARL